MTNPVKILALSLLALVLWSGVAEAVQLNRCARLMENAAGRQAIANICSTCITVKVERHRPGQAKGIPNYREFTIPRGGNQPLPFRGPGRTRIVTEGECPKAVR